jgi:hypothetical protein
MTEPYVPQISFVILTLVWMLVLASKVNPRDTSPNAFRVTWQTWVIAAVLGWVSTLLIEGFGLYGMFAGPEPHM